MNPIPRVSLPIKAFRSLRGILLPLLLLAVLAVPGSAKGTAGSQEDSFSRKPLSAASENVTAGYTPGKKSFAKSTRAFRTAMADTALNLLQARAASAGKTKNILISPDSILTTLSALEQGASGKTRTEIKKALGGITPGKYSRYLNGLHRRIAKDPSIQYKIANSIWYRTNSIRLKKAFLTKMVTDYQAEIYAAPFDDTTVNDMNSWVYNSTRGRISSIIPRLDPSARTVVINAIYFKGDWAKTYGDPTRRTFTAANGKKKKVPTLEGTETTYLSVNGGSGFVKPYAGGKTAFLALLPPRGTSVKKYIRSLSGSDWLKGYKNRVTKGIRVQTRMPEFGYDDSLSLTKPLNKLGIRRMFTPSASFSHMTSSPVEIDDVLHKTHIRVDKNGTEAAAVTAAIAKATAVFEPDPIVKKVYLNRPFVYAIIDTETGLPLFIGAVTKI